MTINDTQVEAALERPLAARGSGMENRANGARLSALAASYTSALSRFHHDARLLPALQGAGFSQAGGSSPESLRLLALLYGALPCALKLLSLGLLWPLSIEKA